MRRFGIRSLPALAVVTILSLCLVWLHWRSYLDTPAGNGKDAVFLEIRKGVGFSTVTRELADLGLLRSPWKLNVYARATDRTRSVKAGEYRLTPDLSPGVMLDMFLRGDVYRVKVIIPEGSTLRDISRQLALLGVISEEGFRNAAGDPDFLSSLDVPGPTLEGYLFPETYLFERKTDPYLVVRTMANQWCKVFHAYRERSREMGLSPREVVTLASLIEKETGLDEERALVSSVFWNRLRKGMRLQSDPTAVYGLEDFDGPITRAHLAADSPYNTYTRRGLPVGPIGSPGEASIRAALNPADTDFLYFVSANDGSHRFSRTLAEHNRYVATFQKKNR